MVASLPKQIFMAEEAFLLWLLDEQNSQEYFPPKWADSNATWWFDWGVMDNLVTRFIKLDICVTLLTMLLYALFSHRSQEDEQNSLTETEEVSWLLGL